MQKITFIALCFCLLLGSCKKGSNDGGVEQPILDTKTKVVLSIPERIVRNANGNQRTSITTNGAQSIIFFSREDAEITVYNEGSIVISQTVTGDSDTLELGLGTYTLDIQYAYPPDDLGKEVSLRYQQEITVEDESGIPITVDWQLQNVPFVLTFNETLVNQLGGNGFDIQVAHPNGGTLNYVYHEDSVYFGFAANFPTEAETVTFTLSGNGKSFERNYDLGEDSTNVLNFQIVNSQLRIQNIEESITIDTRNDDIDVVLVNNGFQLLSVANVSDAGTLELAGAASVSTAVVSGTTYLFVAGYSDDGVSVFQVASDGTLTSVFNISDDPTFSDDPTLQLNGAISVSTAVVSDTTYLFVAGRNDNGVSVFSSGFFWRFDLCI